MEIINQINIHNTSGKKREEISLFVSVIISIIADRVIYMGK